MILLGNRHAAKNKTGKTPHLREVSLLVEEKDNKYYNKQIVQMVRRGKRRGQRRKKQVAGGLVGNMAGGLLTILLRSDSKESQGPPCGHHLGSNLGLATY